MKRHFPDESNIELAPSYLAICISGLQDIKLFNTNLQVIDEAFEYLVANQRKEKKGQYFMPRHVLEVLTSFIGHPANTPFGLDETKEKTFIITKKHLSEFFSNDRFWNGQESSYTTDEFVIKNICWTKTISLFIQ